MQSDSSFILLEAAPHSQNTHWLPSARMSVFPSFFFFFFPPHSVSLDTEEQCFSSWNKCTVGAAVLLQLRKTSKHKFSLAVKVPQPLTSDVLHGDGDGGGEFPRHPEGFVTQLLVHQCTFRKDTKKRVSVRKDLEEASGRFGNTHS